MLTNLRDPQVVGRMMCDELRPLIDAMVKIMRAGIATGPSAPFVAAWIKANPEAAARAIGAFACSIAQKELASSSWTG